MTAARLAEEDVQVDKIIWKCVDLGLQAMVSSVLERPARGAKKMVRRCNKHPGPWAEPKKEIRPMAKSTISASPVQKKTAAGNRIVLRVNAELDSDCCDIEISLSPEDVARFNSLVSRHDMTPDGAIRRALLAGVRAMEALYI